MTGNICAKKVHFYILFKVKAMLSALGWKTNLWDSDTKIYFIKNYY